MYTIRTDYRDETVIEKSRFICTLKKVSSETEAQDFIKAVKKEFWDATHNCSAYIIDELAQRSSDDGEPSGTAGLPMPSAAEKSAERRCSGSDKVFLAGSSLVQAG
ncbi:MAG: YigZ family protein [Phascolarctobacterium faecium]